MLFGSWSGIGRIVVVGILAYGILIVLLRLFGKRMLSKMSAFDLIVTVALGSTLSSVTLSRDVPLADGVTAVVVLLALQFVLAWTAARSARGEQLLKSEPRLLLFRGRFLGGALRSEQVSESGVRAYVRAQGIGDLNDVEAVVLESDGSMNVIPRDSSQFTALSDVPGYPPDDRAQLVT